MLRINRTINVSGESYIANEPVVYMNANISEDGGSSTGINKTINNKTVYEANKEQVRADMRAFEDKVFKIQDEMGTPAE